jgi:microcystin-dependent protein
LVDNTDGIALSSLSYASNTAQSGTIVGFVPPSGTVLSDILDAGTNLGIGRWRGWRRFDEADGRVLVGQLDADDDFGTIGDDGGAKTHTLGMTEIPFHRHAVWNVSPTGTSGGSNNYVGNTDGSSGPGSASTLTREIYDPGVDVDAAQNARGSADIDPGTMGQAHNNLQPYTIVVYMIKL